MSVLEFDCLLAGVGVYIKDLSEVHVILWT